jgi:hypothetical protein
LAALLVGDGNPSGKLPVTFPTSLSQDPAHASPRYPAGSDGYDYAEGLQVGYRWYDAQRLGPLFPFGYGLSYTTFRLGLLHTSTPSTAAASVRSTEGLGPALIRATTAVTNTGSRAGTDIVQLYLTDPESLGEPPHQLKAFSRILLRPGQTKEIRFTPRPLRLRHLGHYKPAVAHRQQDLSRLGRGLLTEPSGDRDRPVVGGPVTVTSLIAASGPVRNPRLDSGHEGDYVVNPGGSAGVSARQGARHSGASQPSIT